MVLKKLRTSKIFNEFFKNQCKGQISKNIELENRNKQQIRKYEFYSLKLKINDAYSRLIALAEIFVIFNDLSEDKTFINNKKADFDEFKQELCNYITELKEYNEISFDSEMEKKIRNWEFESFKTEAELISWQDELSKYFAKLNI